MEINYTDQMTGEEYNELRLSVDWKPLTPGQAERGLAHTAFVVAARDGERIVGMGRMLFDFGYTAYLGDVIIRPEYQGKGLSNALLSRLLELGLEIEGDRNFYLHTQTWSHRAVKLYQKFGFAITKEPNLYKYKNDQYEEAAALLEEIYKTYPKRR